MGYYINKDSKGNPLPNKGKAGHLMDDSADIIVTPTEWRENLVCVVDNGDWEAAAYCYSPGEFHRFMRGKNGRNWIWLV
jgi:hypothetical protein